MGFYLAAYGFGILLMLTVTVLIAAGRKQTGRTALLLMIAVMQVLLAMLASAAVIDAGSIGAYRDSVIADRITELTEGRTSGRILYLESDGESDIGRIQFLLRIRTSLSWTCGKAWMITMRMRWVNGIWC